ncbi:unnamed protein product [Vitrella brassicaformis CCMP3155]|uniref:Uncharacterized protein n=1 Tax=Vitrella brassicaformis (strain CCMP3155) TaxID=1169540 RepID=A0A0G4GNI7_VITBC|nr:unnamed protein product [Vitrella brassicaformis CCMP3155]|eukprot:CEM31838.1 unnamed protein product [Vitrella brassicaformis CCMP3155]
MHLYSFVCRMRLINCRLLPWNRRHDYERVPPDAADECEMVSLSVAIAGEDQTLPADVLGLVVSFLPVDVAVMTRAVGQPYSSQLIDEAFLWRIDSSLAQQQLTGLIDVERDRGVDPSAPPLPPSLSRLGYLARCAYVIEQAAEWPTMATLIKVAGVCGVAGQLPLVLSAESVAAHLPNKASFHRLPTAMAIYNALSHTPPDANDGAAGELQLREVDNRVKASLLIVPATILSRVLLAAFYVICLAAFACVTAGTTLFNCSLISEWLLRDVTRGSILYWAISIFVPVLALTFLLCDSFVASVGTRGIVRRAHKHLRLVQHYGIGSTTFRIIGGDELVCLRPFLWRAYRRDDPPVTLVSLGIIYPSFSSFALHVLLEGAFPTTLRVVLEGQVNPWKARGYRSLYTDGSLSGHSDVLVIDRRWTPVDNKESLFEIVDEIFLSRHRMVVLLLGGGSVVASVSLGGRHIIVRTTEVEAAGGEAVDERLPLTMAAVRRFGLQHLIDGQP